MQLYSEKNVSGVMAPLIIEVVVYCSRPLWTWKTALYIFF